MELDIIKSQTTWNDASQSINLNFAKIRQALASRGGGGGNVDALISTVYDISYLGSISTNDNSATFNAYAIDSLYKRIVLLENKEVDLTGYATETWVLAKNYITSAALSPYLKTADANSTFATLVALNALSVNVGTLEGDVSTLSSNLNTLKGRFDALDDALNDDVSGKINTWNEIVDFLDEYNGSEDLATILSGMNADIALRLKTADFDAWKTDVYSPLASRVSTAEGNIGTHTTQISGLTSRMGSAETNISTNAKGIADNKTAIATNKSNISANATAISNNAKAISANATAINNNATAITNLGKRVTANEGNIAEILKWFAVDADGNLYTTYNLYSTKEISANGLSIGSGSSGGGLISQVFGTTAFGTITSESNSATFNAYAIDSLYKRIVSLEGKATAVSFVPALTSGKQIGTLSIDGVSTVLYGVDAYSKTEADNTFLKLSGGEINGYLSVRHSTSSIALGIKSDATDYAAIRFTGKNGNSAYLVYSGTGDKWEVSNVNWARISVLLHSNNFGDYAISKAGGTITKRNDGSGLAIVAPDTHWAGILLKPNTASVGGTLNYNGTDWRVTDDGWNKAYTLLHSGNYNSYALPLSGGTISGSGSGILTINRTSGTPLISFQANGTNVGFLGIDTVSRPCFVDPVYYETSYLIHSGNYSQYALPLSGGALLSSTIGCLLYLANTKETWNVIGFKGKSHSDYAYLGLGGDGNFFVTTTGWTAAYGLIHSGNIGSFKAGGLESEYLVSLDNAGYNKVFSSGFQATNRPSENYATGLTLYNTELGYTYQLAYSTTGGIFSRYKNGTTWSAWKTVAFTDSNVASATKLATARTIWGQSFDGSGNVNGALKTPSGYNAVTILDSYLVLGQGMAENSLPTYLDGYNVYLRYGKSSTIGFILNSSGNVLVGTTTDTSGNKLQVNGTILSTPARESAYSSVLRGYQSGIVAGDRLSLVIGKESASKNAAYFGFTYDGSGSSKNFASIGFHSVDNILCVAATSYVGIGTTTPEHKLHVNGNIYADGNIALSSRLLAKAGVFCSYESTCGAYMEAGADGTYAGIYTCNNGAWQSSNIYLHNNGNVTINKHLNVNSSTNLKSTLSVVGTITANAGVKVASGQAITFLDASGKEHKLTYDSTAGAFKFDGNILVVGDGQFNAIN